MKTKDLMDAIGGLGDEFIEKYADPKPVVIAGSGSKSKPVKKSGVKRIIAIAAAAAAVIAAALILIPLINGQRNGNGKNIYLEASPTPGAVESAAPTAQPTPAATPVPSEVPTIIPTEQPTITPTEVPTGEPTQRPLTVLPVKLGGEHTATFTFVEKQVFADFELPEGYELRTEMGDETRIPLHVYPVGGVQASCAYIYNQEGVLVGGFQTYYHTEAVEDVPYEDWIYSYFRMSHWRLMTEEMYEPVETENSCCPALSLSEGIVDTESSFAANERFLCDAVIAYDPESLAIIEIVFDRGYLTHDQLIEVAQSIRLSAVYR